MQAVKATHPALSLNRLARECKKPTPKSEIPLFHASWRLLRALVAQGPHMSAVATNPEIMIAPTYTGNAPKAVF